MVGYGTGTGTGRQVAAGAGPLGRNRGWGRGGRFGAAAVAALGLWLGLMAGMGGAELAVAQTLRSQTYSQQYYSPQAEAQRRRNTCIMQRQVTPNMATMCGPGMSCGDRWTGSHPYRYPYGAGAHGTRR